MPLFMRDNTDRPSREGDFVFLAAGFVFFALLLVLFVVFDFALALFFADSRDLLVEGVFFAIEQLLCRQYFRFFRQK